MSEQRPTEVVLILGGAGYIGSHVTRALCEAASSSSPSSSSSSPSSSSCSSQSLCAYEVVVVDSLILGHRESVPASVTFELADVCDFAALDAVFTRHRPSAVVHLCAFSQVGQGETNPLEYYENNVTGAVTLLKVMRKHNVQRIVFSSTAAVYGDTTAQLLTEESPTVPTSCYGNTKLAIEKLLHHCANAYNIRSVSLRYFNACGAHPSGEIGEAHEPESHLIPIVLQVASGKRAALQVFGTDYDTPDGTALRDYIHVCDLATAHIAALDYLRDGGSSLVLNLGTGQGTSVRTIIEVARKVTGHPIPCVDTTRRAGDVTSLVAGADRARSVLGWEPTHSSIENIIETAWRWHSAHADGFSVDARL
eukprot:CAMPEP_0174240606 /NCGR_PEP_ID=MMETSP0417-20130205/19577_1 /TAXON_ID=242541 /ORGANISM="Mayorella sp, Strain BSH-02190019" /LENGTH=364 /DNA_ID=CAMNT_0015319723 /DNA_START=80 /DNA_END=1171 /DNA_ORIENTATION=-